MRVVRGVDDEGQRREQEVDQLRGVGVVDVRLQLGQEVERELELLEDVDKFSFRRRLGPYREHPVAQVLLLRLPAPAALLEFPEGSGRVLKPGDELLDVVEAAVQDGDVALVPVARGGAGSKKGPLVNRNISLTSLLRIVRLA